jgi:hypothetical protein
MTATLVPATGALQDAAVEWPDDVTEIVVLLGQWFNAGETDERARRYGRLVESMCEWLEASGGTSLDPLLGTTIRQAEGCARSAFSIAQRTRHLCCST